MIGDFIFLLFHLAEILDGWSKMPPEENSWTKERQSYCCSHFQRGCAPLVREVPKWVVHDVNVPVDVPVKKEVPVPVTKVKTVQVRVGGCVVGEVM